MSARRKKFATKVRTGCLTCRTRRVKCDETKPRCKRCIAYQSACTYELHWRSPAEVLASLPPGQEAQELSVRREPEPVHWDVLEGLRYYYSLMVPEMHSATDPSEYTHGTLVVLTPQGLPGFLLLIVMHRIRSLCSQNAAAPRPGSLPAINQLWSVLYRYMNNSIRIVNHFIDNQFSIGMRLKSIANLLSVELSILDSPWRAHARGLLAIVNCSGGASTVAAIPNCRLPLHFALLYSMVGNTTSPVDDQIGEFRDWPDADVLQIYTHTFDVDFPCPSRLFLAVRHLSHVRVEAAAAAPAMMRRLLSAATRIADEIGRFSPEDWTERYEIPPRPLSYLLGRVFKTAVTLFAFLALPRVLSRPFLSVEATHGTDPRIHHRSVLTRLLVEAYATRLEKDGWCWPLAVLGVALHDGTAAEQAAVLGLLDEISAPGAYCGPAMLSILLPEFWASGKTGWDDCFRKASQVLA